MNQVGGSAAVPQAAQTQYGGTDREAQGQTQVCMHLDNAYDRIIFQQIQCNASFSGKEFYLWYITQRSYKNEHNLFV